RRVAMNRTATALLLLVLACAPKRTILVGGQQVPYEEVAQQEFRKARAALDQGQNEQAAQLFAGFLEKYPDSELADEAHYRRGQALARAGKPEEAQKVLQTFLEKRPTSPCKNPAAVA